MAVLKEAGWADAAPASSVKEKEDSPGSLSGRKTESKAKGKVEWRDDTGSARSVRTGGTANQDRKGGRHLIGDMHAST